LFCSYNYKEKGHVQMKNKPKTIQYTRDKLYLTNEHKLKKGGTNQPLLFSSFILTIQTLLHHQCPVKIAMEALAHSITGLKYNPKMRVGMAKSITNARAETENVSFGCVLSISRRYIFLITLT